MVVEGKSDDGRFERVADRCIASRVRALSRAVTQLYDDALRPHGLRVTQFNLLAAVHLAGGRGAHAIGSALLMDASTLSRNLARMRDAGWIEDLDGVDGRTRPMQLTPEGHRVFQAAFPAWRAAQQAARELLGKGSRRTLDRLARAAGAFSGVE